MAARKKKSTPKRATKKNLAKPGTKCTLTPELHEKIVAYVAQGNYIDASLALVGVKKSTGYMWLHAGRNYGGEPYESFAHDIERALAQSEAYDLALIGAAAEKDWRAAAWRLEKKNPKRYVQRVSHEVDDELEMFFKKLHGSLKAGKITRESFEEALRVADSLGGEEIQGIEAGIQSDAGEPD